LFFKILWERTMKNLFTVLVLLVCLFEQINSFSKTKEFVPKTTDKKTEETLPFISVFLEGITVGASVNLDGKIAILCISPCKKSISFNCIGYQSNAIQYVQISDNLTTDQDGNLDGITCWLSTIVAQSYVEKIAKDIFSIRTTSQNITNILVPSRNIDNNQTHFPDSRFINYNFNPSIINKNKSLISRKHLAELQKQKISLLFQPTNFIQKINEGKYD
jgi:hypothetical protein